MADSAQNAAPPKSTKFRSSISPGQIQITTNSGIRFVPRCTKKNEFFDLVNFRHVAFEVKTELSYTLKTELSYTESLRIFVQDYEKYA